MLRLYRYDRELALLDDSKISLNSDYNARAKDYFVGVQLQITTKRIETMALVTRKHEMSRPAPSQLLDRP